MNKYSGIDLLSNNCVIPVINEVDRICFERRVPNSFSGTCLGLPTLPSWE